MLLCTAAFVITQLGEEGLLHQRFLRTHVFPALKIVTGTMQNLKFHARGPEKPKEKVLIVEIDSASIETLGRWPWHRDVLAILIDRIFQAGAKVVGLDIVFSEPDPRVPDELRQVLTQKGEPTLADQFETDYALRDAIEFYRDRLVLGWATDGTCQPAYLPYDQCPVTHPDALSSFPKEIPKFGYAYFKKPKSFDPQMTPILSLFSMIPNIKMFNDVATHSATFNASPDPDGYIRRTSLVFMAGGEPYPSLALEMARVGKKEELEIEVDESHRVKKIGFKKSGKEIPVSPLGTMDINFRGPSYTFPYISALEVFGDEDQIRIGVNREIAASKAELFKDAYVLVGLSAIGVYDMRSFPFDSVTPGVEGHANILDNLLAGDSLKAGSTSWYAFIILFLMIVGGILFAMAVEKLESIPGLLVFFAAIISMGFVDQKLSF